MPVGFRKEQLKIDELDGRNMHDSVGIWDPLDIYNSTDQVIWQGQFWEANATTSAGEEPGVSGKWDSIVTSSLSGPGSSTDTALALWDGTDGSAIKNQTYWTIGANGNLVGSAPVTGTGIAVTGGGSDGLGGSFTGGATDGIGLYAIGTGTGMAACFGAGGICSEVISGGIAISGCTAGAGCGVYGQVTTGIAVYGCATSTGIGVYGYATSTGCGINGYAACGMAVRGFAVATGYGGWFCSALGTGLRVQRGSADACNEYAAEIYAGCYTGSLALTAGTGAFICGGYASYTGAGAASGGTGLMVCGGCSRDSTVFTRAGVGLRVWGGLGCDGTTRAYAAIFCGNTCTIGSIYTTGNICGNGVLNVIRGTTTSELTATNTPIGNSLRLLTLNFSHADASGGVNIGGTDHWIRFEGAGGLLGKIKGRAAAGVCFDVSFTGSHYTAIASGDEDTYEPGMIVETTGSMCQISADDSFPIVKLSNTQASSTIFGTFSMKEAVTADEAIGMYSAFCEGEYVHHINQVGEGGVLVTNICGEINNGDYIESSEIKGYGQKQIECPYVNSTVAKVIGQICWACVTDYIEYCAVCYKKVIVPVIYKI